MMANKKDSKLNYHEEENAMVTDLDDLKELGKEMEQISQENDEEKLNQSHDNEVRSDLKNSNRFHKNPVTYQYVKLLDFALYYLSHDLL